MLLGQGGGSWASTTSSEGQPSAERTAVGAVGRPVALGPRQGQHARPAWDPIGDAFAVADRAVRVAIGLLAARKSDDTDAGRLGQSLDGGAGERQVLEDAAWDAWPNSSSRSSRAVGS